MIPVRYSNTRVLIVDDQQEIHDDFVEMLGNTHAEPARADELAAAFLLDVSRNDTSLGIELGLLHATTGDQACETVARARERNERIAVAYVDLRMPGGIDGIETVRRMREIDRDVEIVIMTAYSDAPLPEVVRNVDLLHKLVFMRKPFAYEEIQQLTISLVGKWNLERNLMEKQEQLAASHRRLEAVLDATGDAIAMLDTEGRLVFCNALYRELLGLDDENKEKIGLDALAARCAQRFREPQLGDSQARLLFDHGSVSEATGHDDAAQRRLFYQSSAAVHDGHGQVIGAMIAYRNVSEEIEAERLKARVLRLGSTRTREDACSFAGVMGDSLVMRDVYALIEQAAEGDITVLIRGESGTGKEMVARSCHGNGRRSDGPFVTIDCASIPESLIETELFGHERGSFTGAAAQHIGAFERAHGGTILLDEIGEMPYSLQTRLLRVLQEREVRRVGGRTTVPVDIRVIAATNKDLESAVAKGEFREDLFYRISAFHISIPPLRERREDIPVLARHFLEKYAARAGKSFSGISTAALGVLLQYDWPGNVRELENCIERAVLLGAGSVLQVGDLPPAMYPRDPIRAGSDRVAVGLTLAEVERQAIKTALTLTHHHVTRAAQALDISRATLHRKIVKYGFSRG